MHLMLKHIFKCFTGAEPERLTCRIQPSIRRFRSSFAALILRNKIVQNRKNLLCYHIHYPSESFGSTYPAIGPVDMPLRTRLLQPRWKLGQASKNKNLILCAYTYACVYIYTRTYTCVSVYMCVSCMHACMHMYQPKRQRIRVKHLFL